MTLPAERFWSKVNVNGPGGCWLWTAGKNGKGYGRFGTTLRGNVHAHRFAWEFVNDRPVPIGLQLDHLCRVRNCVNPAHLEPVTPGENTRRGEPAQRTHCPVGHEYVDYNLVVYRGNRRCRACRNVRSRNRHRRLALAISPGGLS